MNTNEHKANAAAAGLEWPIVLAAYREARRLEADEIERIAVDRRNIAAALTGDDHAGRLRGRNRVALTTGDATGIVGLDVVAADRDQTADELYADLHDAAPTMRPADDVMRETIDRLAAMAAATVAEEWIPLPAAAARADITEQWLRLLVKAGKVRGRRNGRRWEVSAGDVEWFKRHPTAGRPRLRAHLESAPF